MWFGWLLRAFFRAKAEGIKQMLSPKKIGLMMCVSRSELHSTNI